MKNIFGIKVIASDKYVRSTPRKVSEVANKIRGKHVAEVALILSVCKKKPAFVLGVLLKAVVSNAYNKYGIPADKLFLEEVNVGRSIVLKRASYRAKGRVDTIEKTSSKIRLVVREIVDVSEQNISTLNTQSFNAESLDSNKIISNDVQ